MIKAWEEKQASLCSEFERESGDHLQYLHPLDHGKQVRGLGKRVYTDLKRDMGLTYAFPAVFTLISAHFKSWLYSPKTQDLLLETLTPPNS